jgi:AcrR family transcriptional regulator
MTNQRTNAGNMDGERPAPDRTAAGRGPLTREQVLRAAIRLADEAGLEGLSMRRLGQELRVEAMSLYKHVAGKDEILDEMADRIAGDFDVPAANADWKSELRRSAVSAHATLLRHPWASALIESRSSAGPCRLRYLEAVIGTLSGAGFDMPTIVRAIMTLDSYTYGFVLQELAWPFGGDDEAAASVAVAFAEALPEGKFPHLAAMAELASHPGGAPADFEFGLDLILDGFDDMRGGR